MASPDLNPDSIIPMDREELTALRDKIIGASLPHIPFDGWSMASLHLGCRDADEKPEQLILTFPDGVAGAVEHYIDWVDRQMMAALVELPLEQMRVRDRIATAIKLRLQICTPHREVIRRTLNFIALPKHTLLAARSLYRTVDMIWYAAGDQSTDFNFYTKRGLLAGVYSTSLLYWLRDTSPDYSESWAFLQRRIENIMQFGRGVGQFSKIVGRLPDPFFFARCLRRGFGEHRSL